MFTAGGEGPVTEVDLTRLPCELVSERHDCRQIPNVMFPRVFVPCSVLKVLVTSDIIVPYQKDVVMLFIYIPLNRYI